MYCHFSLSRGRSRGFLRFPETGQVNFKVMVQKFRSKYSNRVVDHHSRAVTFCIS